MVVTPGERDGGTKTEARATASITTIFFFYAAPVSSMSGRYGWRKIIPRCAACIASGDCVCARARPGVVARAPSARRSVTTQ